MNSNIGNQRQAFGHNFNQYRAPIINNNLNYNHNRINIINNNVVSSQNTQNYQLNNTHYQYRQQPSQPRAPTKLHPNGNYNIPPNPMNKQMYRSDMVVNNKYNHPNYMQPQNTTTNNNIYARNMCIQPPTFNNRNQINQQVNYNYNYQPINHQVPTINTIRSIPYFPTNTQTIQPQINHNVRQKQTYKPINNYNIISNNTQKRPTMNSNQMNRNQMNTNQTNMNQMNSNQINKNQMNTNQRNMNPMSRNQMNINRNQMNPMSRNQPNMNPMSRNQMNINRANMNQLQTNVNHMNRKHIHYQPRNTINTITNYQQNNFINIPNQSQQKPLRVANTYLNRPTFVPNRKINNTQPKLIIPPPITFIPPPPINIPPPPINIPTNIPINIPINTPINIPINIYPLPINSINPLPLLNVLQEPFPLSQSPSNSPSQIRVTPSPPPLLPPPNMFNLPKLNIINLPPINLNVNIPFPQPIKINNLKPILEQERKNDNNYKDDYYPKYAVNYSHTQILINNFSDTITVNLNHSNYSAFSLLKVFDTLQINTSDLEIWSLSNQSGARSNLSQCVNYSETNQRCSKDVKIKLRIIAKLIMESKDKSDYIHILLLLASHGHVCNVMKEVAINNAYGMMTNNFRDYIESQTLQQQILKVLRDYRVLLVEELFHQFKFQNNTHVIAGFHNEIADKIGVEKYNDENISRPWMFSKSGDWKRNLDKRFFKTLYTKKKIVKHIIKQINEKKIGYQKIVKYFEENHPKNMDKMEFLQKTIDINTGELNEEYLCWLLEKLNIFQIKSNNWTDTQKCWDDMY